MKPFTSILRQGLVIVCLTLLLAAPAGAQGWRQGYGGNRAGGRAEAAYAPRGGFDRAPYAMGRGGRFREARPFGRRAYQTPYDGYPPAYAPPPPLVRGGWRRGAFLPPAYWSGEAGNPHSHHLRTPPPGYGWYGIGRDAYLVQRSTGLILDTAPGGW